MLTCDWFCCSAENSFARVNSALHSIRPGWVCMRTRNLYPASRQRSGLDAPSQIFQTPIFTLLFDRGLRARSHAKSSVGTTNIPCTQALKCQQRYHTGEAPTFLGFRLRPHQAGFIWKRTKPMLAVAMSTWLAALGGSERRAEAEENKKSGQLTEGGLGVKAEWQTKTPPTSAHTHTHAHALTHTTSKDHCQCHHWSWPFRFWLL